MDVSAILMGWMAYLAEWDSHGNLRWCRKIYRMFLDKSGARRWSPPRWRLVLRREHPHQTCPWERVSEFMRHKKQQHFLTIKLTNFTCSQGLNHHVTPKLPSIQVSLHQISYHFQFHNHWVAAVWQHWTMQTQSNLNFQELQELFFEE